MCGRTKANSARERKTRGKEGVTRRRRARCSEFRPILECRANDRVLCAGVVLCWGCCWCLWVGVVLCACVCTCAWERGRVRGGAFGVRTAVLGVGRKKKSEHTAQLRGAVHVATWPPRRNCRDPNEFVARFYGSHMPRATNSIERTLLISDCAGFKALCGG